MRQVSIFWAHVKAYMLVLTDCLGGRLNGSTIIPPLLVYSKQSVENTKRGGVQVTRQVGVGFWTEGATPGPGRRWTDFRVYFLEEYNMETQTWKRVK